MAIPTSTDTQQSASPSNWELQFGSDDDPAGIHLQAQLEAQFGNDIEDLQEVLAGCPFEDALTEIDSTFDLPCPLPSSDGHCLWHASVAVADEESSSSPVTSSSSNLYDCYADLSNPLLFEHEYWYFNSFLTHPTATRCFYSDVLDHCKRFNITASNVHDAIPSLLCTVQAADCNYKSF